MHTPTIVMPAYRNVFQKNLKNGSAEKSCG